MFKGIYQKKFFRVIKQVSQMTVISLDQNIALKGKFSRPKTGQRSSYTRRGFPNKGNEIYFYARLTQTSTTTVLCNFYDLNMALGVRTSEGLHWAVMNADELDKVSMEI